MKKLQLIYLIFFALSCNSKEVSSQEDSPSLKELLSFSNNEILDLAEINESQLRLNESIIALGIKDTSIIKVWALDNNSKRLIELIKNDLFKDDIEEKINNILINFNIKPLDYDNKYEGVNKKLYNLSYIKSVYIKSTLYYIKNHRELLIKNRLKLVVQEKN